MQASASAPQKPGQDVTADDIPESSMIAARLAVPTSATEALAWLRLVAQGS
jgi:hypothetical protein